MAGWWFYRRRWRKRWWCRCVRVRVGRPCTTHSEEAGAGREIGRPTTEGCGTSRGDVVRRTGCTSAACRDATGGAQRLSIPIDAEDRTRQVSGTITLGAASKRARSAQAAAGGADRLSTDDGGHYIAARFNGPRDAFNHFAQDANFNRGGYRVLENRWARDTCVGRKVYVKITPEYVGHSSRPDRILVSYLVDGREKSREFRNERQDGARHGR